MNRILCAISVLITLNAYVAKGIEPERIIDMYKERLGLVSDASGSYTMTRGLSEPAQALYARQKSEKNVSKMWELLDVLPSETRVDFAYNGDEYYSHTVYKPDPERNEAPRDTECVCQGNTVTVRDAIKNTVSTRNRDDTGPVIDGHNPLFLGMMYYPDDRNLNYRQLVTEDGIGVPPNLYRVDYFEDMGKDFSEEMLDGRKCLKIKASDKYFEKAKMYCVAWLDPLMGYLVRKMEVRGVEKNEMKNSYETTEFQRVSVNGRDMWIAKEAVMKELYSDRLVEGMEAPLSVVTIRLNDVAFGDGGNKIKKIAP